MHPLQNRSLLHTFTVEVHANKGEEPDENASLRAYCDLVWLVKPALTRRAVEDDGRESRDAGRSEPRAGSPKFAVSETLRFSRSGPVLLTA